MDRNFSGSRRSGQPGTNGKAPVAPIEPLVVRPKNACVLLGIGHTRLFAMLKAGELESFMDGGSRLITVSSIRAHIAKKLAEARAGKASS
jgi:hypothetical protein